MCNIRPLFITSNTAIWRPKNLLIVNYLSNNTFLILEHVFFILYISIYINRLIDSWSDALRNEPLRNEPLWNEVFRNELLRHELLSSWFKDKFEWPVWSHDCVQHRIHRVSLGVVQLKLLYDLQYVGTAD